MSQEGFDKISAELDDLKIRGRAEAAKAIAEAREKGDLSENAEYDAAKDAQGLLEMKINQLDKIVASARIIDASQIDTSKVTVLSKVRIKNVKMNKEFTYTLVSEAEGDIKNKKLSVNSPIGQGLLGKVVGEIAKIKTPAGEMEFEIMEIGLS